MLEAGAGDLLRLEFPMDLSGCSWRQDGRRQEWGQDAWVERRRFGADRGTEEEGRGQIWVTSRTWPELRQLSVYCLIGK